MSFNRKYHPYVDELPPYVLEKISKRIIEKYQKHEANDYIDSVFKTHAEAYKKKKRVYDSQYYSKNQDYHKANKLPIPKMP